MRTPSWLFQLPITTNPQARRSLPLRLIGLMLLLGLLATACNLGAAPPDAEVTELATTTGGAPTRTLIGTGDGSSAVSTVTQIPRPTFNFTQPTSIGFIQPTFVAVLPPTLPPRPTNTTTPTSIVIISPVQGNVISGNVQVIGSAIHPDFLQYRLEYGPDPNGSKPVLPHHQYRADTSIQRRFRRVEHQHTRQPRWRVSDPSARVPARWPSGNDRRQQRRRAQHRPHPGAFQHAECGTPDRCLQPGSHHRPGTAGGTLHQ